MTLSTATSKLDLSLLPESPDNDIIAAIDMGSNSFHLVVARYHQGSIQTLVKDKHMVKLASGLNQDHILSEEAIERGLAVLRSFARTIENIDPDNIRAVATFTLRKAKNADQFIQRANDFLNIPIEIISGDEEARLIYQGVAHTSHLAGKRLVVDIGGGSTELAIGEGFSHLELSSQPLGCVVFTERFFADGNIDLTSFDAAVIAAKQRLELIDQRYISQGWQHALGSSGTVKAVVQYLAQCHPSGLFTGPITTEHLKQLKQHLIQAQHVDQIQHIEEHRRKVIPAGLAILIAVFEQLNIQQMYLSESALREGVLYELSDRMQHHDIRQRTVDSISARYAADKAQVNRVKATAHYLFEHIQSNYSASQANRLRNYLNWAIDLHEIGLNINRRGLQKHAAYIIEHSELPGFSYTEQKILANLVSLHRKRIKQDTLTLLNGIKDLDFTCLVIILRLAAIFNLRRIEQPQPTISFSNHKDGFHLCLDKQWITARTLLQEDLKTELQVLNQVNISLKIDFI